MVHLVGQPKNNQTKEKAKYHFVAWQPKNKQSRRKKLWRTGTNDHSFGLLATRKKLQRSGANDHLFGSLVGQQ